MPFVSAPARDFRQPYYFENDNTCVEHHPTPDFILDPMSDYNQSARIDNTRVYKPYNY